MIEGMNDNNEENGVDAYCHYGDHMEVEGEVTTVEAVSRYFDVYLKVCLKSYQGASSRINNWYSRDGNRGRKCLKYQTALDLSSIEGKEGDEQNGGNNNEAEEEEEEEAAEDQWEYRNQNEDDFLPEGTYKWTAYLQVPPKTTGFTSCKS